MTVGGWFDAEDLFGPINIYKTIEKTSPGAKNTIVMGPWGHGDWADEKAKSTHNHIYFGDSIASFYQKEIEFKFFARYLKDQGTEDMPEAYVFNTGTKKWEKHDVWPPKEAASLQMRFEPNGKLVINKEVSAENAFEYISDPAKPVPYTSQTEGLTFTPRNFMSDDQREASMRPDVLTFETEVLGDEVTIAGEILAKLKVAMSGTDAMLLKGLFEELFLRGVTLVATSNIIPDRLYENGLQRERFLPAIALVKEFCQVLNVDSGIDYRLRVLTHVELYHSPLDAEAESNLQSSFNELAQGAVIHYDDIIVNERVVAVRARTEDVLWCDYHELCEKPRSASDYIEIAREYHTVLLSNVPIMGEKNDDSTRRFINLIDEFYDRQVKLIVTAAAPIEGMYSGGRLNFEIQRTRSRLQEMQSREYLELPHLP